MALPTISRENTTRSGSSSGSGFHVTNNPPVLPLPACTGKIRPQADNWTQLWPSTPASFRLSTQRVTALCSEKIESVRGKSVNMFKQIRCRKLMSLDMVGKCCD